MALGELPRRRERGRGGRGPGSGAAARGRAAWERSSAPSAAADLPFGATSGAGFGTGLPNAPDEDIAAAAASDLAGRFEEAERQDRIDEKLGFCRYTEGPERLGWLINMRAVSLDSRARPGSPAPARFACFRERVPRRPDTPRGQIPTTCVPRADCPNGRAGVDYYFVEQDGGLFKCTVLSDPSRAASSPHFLPHGRSNSTDFLNDLRGHAIRSGRNFVQQGTENEVEEYLRRRFEKTVLHVNRVQKEDLSTVR
ncbi:MAG: hypothetical protein BJ554DRAFT_2848 [Olpidium bornovanus]|uniref:DNA polymerase epsilon catalytic subunit n=1 Tax=Olpidium bornovanus TaxID=278681 RepID=A0A8H7ZPV5_9FUNG|nr:MAG: hypothetical protein BJ554DRAFT_2848 [Olpidium bornovanus]